MSTNMASFLLISLVLLPCTFLVWNIHTFSINYSRAPGRFLLPIFERVPFDPGNFTRFCRHGFEIGDTYHWVDEFGDAFVTVSPAKI
ncbi:uncharacterized protein BDZ99DRAFT_522524 [Mytilinidion resinicola]|uniref:Uncharacterized protein n=1 Tax=Mytilinidion resinicola TaxID=574789 RepID=A0A6A6YGH8_9PEZI|nr:uncharacterized protein BDZ99DRAFT_522524 [Mytilinidion resinicola]KAF2807916.1 hypothetical protein BDZ99DRAFT_522524 [Mytilinidion resinicola]